MAGIRSRTQRAFFSLFSGDFEPFSTPQAVDPFQVHLPASRLHHPADTAITDSLFMVIETLRRANHRTGEREWLKAARDIADVGYCLNEPLRNAHSLLRLSVQLAEVSVDLKDDSAAEQWLEHGREWLVAPTKFKSNEARLSLQFFFYFSNGQIQMRLLERSKDQSRNKALLDSALASFDKSEELVTKCQHAIDGDINLMLAEIAQRKAIIYDRVGDYRVALSEVRRAATYQVDFRDPDWIAEVSLHEAELSAKTGKILVSRRIVDSLLTKPDLSLRLKKRVQGFEIYLSKCLTPTLDWLSSDAAKQIARLARENGLRSAIAEISQKLVDVWMAWKTDDDPWPASELFDFWGRGAFMRIVAAVRARPTHAIAVDASSIEEIRHWARVFCPLFDTVIIKWKGRLGAGLVIVPRHISQGGDGDFGGHGYVSTADFVKPEWNATMGWANPVPFDVCKFLATEAIDLIKQGRLAVIPAPLVGASQFDCGWTDDLLTGGLFRGVVNAAQIDVSPNDGRSKDARIIDVTSAAIPYIREIPLPTLADMLEELTDSVQILRGLWNSEIAYVTSDDWQKINTLENDFNDACKLLREKMEGLTKDATLVASLRSGTSAMSPADIPGKAPLLTDILQDMTTDREIGPWIPFWRLSEQGGQLDWNAATDRTGTVAPPEGMMHIDTFGPAMHSWLCPGDAGCGIALARRY